MNLAVNRVWSVLAIVTAVVFGAFTPAARALPVSVDLAALRAIQTHAAGKSDDQAYLLVSGVANGKEFSDRFPKEKTWTVAPKKPVASTKEPVTLWTGDLADGEFALVSVTLMQGTGEDAAKIKDYLDKKGEVEKKVTERSKAKLTDTDFENVSSATLKAQQGVVKDIKKIFSREQKTDHYGGLFNVLVWNKGGKIIKRIDPVGLTFGEHFGIDAKIYSKLKNTRPNVMMQDEKGEWAEQQLAPIGEQNVLRVKMLETEMIKGAGDPEKIVTDYLAEIQVKASGKSLPWELGAEQTGPSDMHTYWEFAK